FAAKIAQVLIVSIIQIALLIVLGVAMYDVQVPDSAERWWTFTWVFLLGTAASTALGIATSSILRNGKAASAILTPVVLVLQFTSGVFVVFTQLPEWLQAFGSVFPLRWLAQGMRSVFLPEQFALAEAQGEWQHGITAIVLVVWLVIGLAVAMK